MSLGGGKLKLADRKKNLQSKHQKRGIHTSTVIGLSDPKTKRWLAVKLESRLAKIHFNRQVDISVWLRT